VKIWTKRAASVGAILGGLLVAGTVAANAADLPMVGALNSLPLVGQATQQATQQATRAGSAVPMVVERSTARGIGSGTTVDLGLRNTSVKAPVTVCGNTVNVVGKFNKARCRHRAASGGHRTSPTTGSRGSVTSRNASGILTGTTAGARVEDTSVELPITGCGNTVNAVGMGSRSSC
jgi:hypothetical protein